MEFIEVVANRKEVDTEVGIHLVTIADEFKHEQQLEYFSQIQTAAVSIGIHFTWEFDEQHTIHDRSIVTDHGWKIVIGRGLDIYQQYDMNDAFSFANRLQQFRSCKQFEITYIKV